MSAFVLNLSKSGNILFRSMPNGNCLYISTSFVIICRRQLTGAWLRVIAAAQLHCKCKILCLTPCIEISYGKSRSVISDKLFSSLRLESVWNSIESTRLQNKWLELLLSFICPGRSVDRMSRWGNTSLLCVLSLSSVLRRFILYCVPAPLSHPNLFSDISNIFP